MIDKPQSEPSGNDALHCSVLGILKKIDLEESVYLHEWEPYKSRSLKQTDTFVRLGLLMT